MRFIFDNYYQMSVLVDSIARSNTCPAEMMLEEPEDCILPECKACWQKAIEAISEIKTNEDYI